MAIAVKMRLKGMKIRDEFICPITTELLRLVMTDSSFQITVSDSNDYLTVTLSLLLMGIHMSDKRSKNG